MTARQGIKVHLFFGTLLAAGIVSLGLGCATVMSPPSYSVSVSSEPAGAIVRVVNEFDNSVIASAVTPGVVSLRPSAGPFKAARYEFQFEKDGYEQERVGHYAGINVWALLDVPCGLFCFSPILMLIDANSGSLFVLRGTVHATLSPKQLPKNRLDVSKSKTPKMFKVPAADMDRLVEGASEAVNPATRYGISVYVEDDPAKNDTILGNGDGLIQKGEAFELVVVVANTSTSTAKDVVCTVILPEDQSLKSYSEIHQDWAELAPAAAATNRINLVMPMNVKLTAAPVCRIEVQGEGSAVVEHLTYQLPMDLE